jgi:hypothetical protein
VQLAQAIRLASAYGTTVGALLDEGPDKATVLLIEAAHAWAALRRHSGAPEGSAESQRIARDVMGILCRTDAGRDSNRDSNRDRGHQRTAMDKGADDQG